MGNAFKTDSQRHNEAKKAVSEWWRDCQFGYIGNPPKRFIFTGNIKYFNKNHKCNVEVFIDQKNGQITSEIDFGDVNKYTSQRQKIYNYNIIHSYDAEIYDRVSCTKFYLICNLAVFLNSKYEPYLNRRNLNGHIKKKARELSKKHYRPYLLEIAGKANFEIRCHIEGSKYGEHSYYCFSTNYDKDFYVSDYIWGGDEYNKYLTFNAGYVHGVIKIENCIFPCLSDEESKEENREETARQMFEIIQMRYIDQINKAYVGAIEYWEKYKKIEYEQARQKEEQAKQKEEQARQIEEQKRIEENNRKVLQEQQRLLDEAKKKKEEKAQKAAPDKKECPICYEGELTHANISCGHMLCCIRCLPMIRDTNKCPKCRAPISQTIRIYV